MAKQAGYTFVELLVVVAIVGILSSMSLNILPGIVKPRSLLLESDVLASNIALSISKAKSTQSTFRLLCDPQSVSVNYYSGVRSNSLNTSVGLDAALQTASKPFRSQFFLSPNRKLTIQCPTNCGDVFISSDGLLLTSGVCGSIDFVLAKASSPDALIKLSLSNLGYPRVYTKSAQSSDVWSELLR